LGKLVTMAVMWHVPPDSGGGHIPMLILNNNLKKDWNCNRQVGLYTGENKRGIRILNKQSLQG
jgi:hypothetical protein